MSVIKKLHYKAQDFELKIDDLEILDQGVTVIQGPSGSGKSTLLNILIGVESAIEFDWTFKGEKLSHLSMADRRLGVVFQSYDLFPHLTAEENVLLVLKARHSPEARTEILEKLELYKNQLKISNCWSTLAHQLSGGEKQRIAFLRAVVSRPRMLLLDEPFSALDQNLRIESRQSLKKFLLQVDIPALLVTHDQDDVEALADRVIYLNEGRITKSLN